MSGKPLKSSVLKNSRRKVLKQCAAGSTVKVNRKKGEEKISTSRVK